MLTTGNLACDANPRTYRVPAGDDENSPQSEETNVVDCGPEGIFDCSGQCMLVSEYEEWISDGYCDSAEHSLVNLNCAEHNFDGGDCCTSSCVDAAFECGTNGFACTDPQACAQEESCGDENETTPGEETPDEDAPDEETQDDPVTTDNEVTLSFGQLNPISNEVEILLTSNVALAHIAFELTQVAIDNYNFNETIAAYLNFSDVGNRINGALIGNEGLPAASAVPLMMVELSALNTQAELEICFDSVEVGAVQTATPLNVATGDCLSLQLGCTQPDACNFTTQAQFNNDSCAYAEENFDCDDNCLLEVDCTGACGGDAQEDTCGTCDNNPENDCVQDCADTWGGQAVVDECGVCGGTGNCEVGTACFIAGNFCQDPSIEECVFDCNMECRTTTQGRTPGDGTCNESFSCIDFGHDGGDCGAGDACVASPYNNGSLCQNGEACMLDCNDTCISTQASIWLNDGQCTIDDNIDLSCFLEEASDCALDCAGTAGGNAELDNCDTCDDNPTNDCTQDCHGEWGGTAVLSGCDNACGSTLEVDECGMCGGTGIPEGACDCEDNVDLGCGCGEDAPSGCDNTCGSTLELDNCGVCDGDNTTCDENEDPVDDIEACDLPANHFYLQDNAVLYNSENAIGGFQFDLIDATPTAAFGGDTAEAGLIIQTQNQRVLAFSFTGGFIPAGCGTLTMLSISGTATGLRDIVVSDPDGNELDFEAYTDEDTCDMDCNDECGGDASEDNCGVCDADPTNDCVADCNDEYDGDAVEDNCGVCDDDPTNDCLADCNGEYGGAAVEDNCGVCDDDPTNDCVADCNGDWGGDAVEDNCGVCDDDPTNDCLDDCNGEWGGSAELDACEVCDGDGSTCEDVCQEAPEDINQDGETNVLDVVSLVTAILVDPSEGHCSGDINADEVINVLDIVLMVDSILGDGEDDDDDDDDDDKGDDDNTGNLNP